MPTLQDYACVADASTRDELRDSLISLAAKLDFPLLTTMLVIERPQQPPACVPLSNVPPGFAEASLEATGIKRDPVLHALARSHLPFVWTQRTYTDAAAGDLWEIQAPFGYHNGVAVALHLPGARHFLLGVDRQDRLPTRSKQLSRLLADVHLMAVHAQAAAVRLLTPLVQQDPSVQLTPREIEVLRWTKLGKDAAAIALILGLSVHTVKFHCENAIRKLGAENKHGAVIKALEFGLLDLEPGAS